MKIGLTGATGFIGRYLLPRLIDGNELVITTSNDKISKWDNVKYVKVDYSAEQYVQAFAGCEAVIHLGARIQHDLKIKRQTFEMYKGNITSSDNVLYACKECGITNVVLASSIAVYHKDSGVIYDEESETIPLTYYGYSKVCCEKLAEMYNNNFNMHIKSLRLGYVYGYNDNPEVQNSLLMYFLELAKKGEPLPVFGDGSSANVYIYIKDAVDAIICAMNRPDVSGAFNIANPKCTTALEFAEAFCRVFPGLEIKMIPEKRVTGAEWELSGEKAREILGFSTKYSVMDAIHDMSE